MRNIPKEYEKDLEKLNFEKSEFKPVYKIGNKLSNIIKKGKDKLDKEDQHNIIYKIFYFLLNVTIIMLITLDIRKKL